LLLLLRLELIFDLAVERVLLDLELVEFIHQKSHSAGQGVDLGLKTTILFGLYVLESTHAILVKRRVVHLPVDIL